MIQALKLCFVFSLFTQAVFAQPLPLPDDPQQPAPPPPHNDHYTYILGVQAVDRFRGRFVDFYPRQGLSQFVQLRVVGLDHPIDIKQVRIVYDFSNEVFDALALRGRLSQGQSRGIILSGRPIYRVEVIAMAGSVFKKAGNYQVEVSVRRP